MYVALTRAMARVYLPFAVVREVSPKPGRLPDARDPASLSGAYAAVHRRLADVLGSGTPGFTVEDVAPEQALKGTPVRVSGVPWEPEAKWLVSARDDRPYARLREQHAAAIMTSYTRLHRENDLRSQWADGEPEPPHSDSALDETDETVLRSARVSGIFLHELLERVPVCSFGAPDFDSWRTLPDIAALVDEATGIFCIARAQRQHAERLVWSAFTTPVKLPGGGQVDGLARAKQMVREMAFVFACPTSDPRVPVYARGSIDLAFEHDGQTYFVDWKSDSLTVYDRSALEEHVRSHYAQQVELYTLAIVELLGAATQIEYEARFGGILYSFLRGMGPQGVWSTRPSWEDVIAWKGNLARRLSSERAP
jgi:ATP-dependent exoDNAse (exonuclease V) beta subunit